MTIKGHYSNGVIVPDEPVVLAEGMRCVISFEQASPDAIQEPDDALRASLAARHPSLMALAGHDLDLPADASMNVDHYLYGHPKRT